VDHGVFGYARPVASTTEAVVEALWRRHGWRVEPDWIVWLPGLVVGLNVTALACAEAGDEVLTLSPVYPPFSSAPRNNARVPVGVPWVREAGGWGIDWDALASAVTPRTRAGALLWPSPPRRRSAAATRRSRCPRPPARAFASSSS
jgi:cystathionine beta-lyase